MLFLLHNKEDISKVFFFFFSNLCTEVWEKTIKGRVIILKGRLTPLTCSVETLPLWILFFHFVGSWVPSILLTSWNYKINDSFHPVVTLHSKSWWLPPAATCLHPNSHFVLSGCSSGPMWSQLELPGLPFSLMQKEFSSTHCFHLSKDNFPLPVFCNSVSCGTWGKSSQQWNEQHLSKEKCSSQKCLSLLLHFSYPIESLLSNKWMPLKN